MSAVILAVIVIMWAVVLVPMWLRRHDAATESRSVDRFSTAMRVLSRRGQGAPDRRYVLMPKRDAQASVHVSGASAHRRPPSRPAPPAPPARPKTRTSLAVRRRRALLALVGVTFLTFVLTLVGAIGWPLQFVVDLILVAFVVHLRTQAKRTAAVTRQRRRAAVAPPAGHPSYAAAGARARRVPAYADERATEPMQPVQPAAPEPAGPAPFAAEAAATGTDDRWEPVPVPRPTYTMKPKAPQRWTYTRPEAPAAQAAEDAPPAAEEAPVTPEPREVAELDGILEHRWAVND